MLDKRVVAYYPIHYGIEWLYWSLRSVAPYVDGVVIVYSRNPSHGHTSTMENPETMADILNVVSSYCENNPDNKVDFVSYEGPNHEGHLRDYCVNLCSKEYGADVVMAVDADEIWEPEHLLKTLDYVIEHDNMIWRVPFVHYWKSLYRVCHDPAQPHRFTDVTSFNKDDNYVPAIYGSVHHFGYAQSLELVEYKLSIHGHKAEIRPNWFEEVYSNPGRMFDLHPTNRNFWNCSYTTPNAELQKLLFDHPYYDIRNIEHKWRQVMITQKYSFIPVE